MSKYGTIPAAAASSTPQPDYGSPPTALDPPSSCAATCPAPAFPFRPWRELADPRALSVPRGLAAARRRARANVARFAANYQLAFLAVVSVALCWRPRCLPSVILCFLFLSGRFFPAIMALTLLQNMLAGAAASVLVSLPVTILPVVLHAVLHECPADDGADGDDEAGSIVWRRGVIVQGDDTTTGPPPVHELA